MEEMVFLNEQRREGALWIARSPYTLLLPNVLNVYSEIIDVFIRSRHLYRYIVNH